jgi:hypothetical protein
LNLKDGKVNVVSETMEETLVLDNVGVAYANTKSLYSNSFVKNTIKEAETSSMQESGHYKKVKATDIVEKSDISGDIFFDDNRSTVINYAAVTPGSVTRLESEQEYTDARLVGQFFFASYLASLESELVIKAHRNIQINYLLQNCTDKDVEFSREEKGKYVLYTWRARNSKKYLSAGLAPSLKYYVPHIIFYVTRYVNQNDTLKVLSSSQDLYKWYAQAL